jgi:hypothetical protein
MSNPPSSTPFNRRQWLKATGATLAGVVLAARLPGGLTVAPAVRRARDADETPRPLAPRAGRSYVHGFEAYPGG